MSPPESTTYVGQIKVKDGTMECKLDIKVVKENELFDPTEALCAHKEGVGRNILVINNYIGEGLPAFLDQDFNEIKEMTGISYFKIDGVNYSAVTAEIESGKYDAIWFFAACSPLLTKERSDVLAPLLRNAAERGVGLVYMGDNDPCASDVSTLLGSTYPEWELTLSGNFYGMGKVGKEGFPSDGKGLLHDHAISAGIYQSISEGITISQISKPSDLISTSFLPVLRNTEGNLTTAAIEHDLKDPSKAGKNAAIKGGKPQFRAIIHGAYTGMFRSGPESEWGWEAKKSPATPQFFANMACWSVGVK